MVGVEALHVALLLAAEGRGGREGRGGEGATHLVEAEGGQAAVLPLTHPVVGGQRAAGGGGGAPQPVHLQHHCNQVTGINSDPDHATYVSDLKDVNKRFFSTFFLLVTFGIYIYIIFRR
jgi:hypothetical protein